MKKKPVFWIMAGTSEGRLLAQTLSGAHAEVHASVATEYGKALIEPKENLQVHSKRLNQEEMISLFNEINPDCVIDATHPYASAVTDNTFHACEETGTEYLRLLRAEGDHKGFLTADSSKHAAEILNNTSGNIFLTCGSKEIEAFTAVKNYSERIYARVLPMKEVMEKCEKLGFQSSHMIYMQGPFSREFNQAMLKQTDARYLVTKDSGTQGGFLEKIEAALELGISVIVIGRPQQRNGLSMEQILKVISDRYDLDMKQNSAQESGRSFFPLFVSLKNKRVLVFGGGTIAKRRVETLMEFEPQIHIIAPRICETIAELARKNRLLVQKREYCFGDCKNADLVIASTDDPAVNARIAEECRQYGIPVSVADKKELCTFLFPGIIKKENMVIGVTSGGEDHARVKHAAEYLRLRIDEIIE